MTPGEVAVFGAAFAIEYLRCHAERPWDDAANVYDAAHAASNLVDKAHHAGILLATVAEGEGIEAVRAARTLIRLKEFLKQ